MNFQHKRVIVIGNNGSGKSYFSKKLSEITRLPLVHLDLLYWQENWTHPSQDEWAEIQRKLVSENKWIIDGMHTSTLEIRFKEADAVYFLDFDKDICLDAVKQRELAARKDFPDNLDKNHGNFEDFIRGIGEFDEKRKPRILDLHNKYSSKAFIVFRTREEINGYLKELERQI